GREVGLALVDIGDGESAVGGEVAGADRDVLLDAVGRHPADHRHVGGAVDGDGDDLAGGAVARNRGEAVGDRLAGAELLDRGLAVAGGGGPTGVGGGAEGGGGGCTAQ